jgi:hypothetical protein
VFAEVSRGAKRSVSRCGVKQKWNEAEVELSRSVCGREHVAVTILAD